MGRGKSEKTRRLMVACHTILAEMQPATVRAVCYRLFVAGLIPSMAKAHTNRVSKLLTEAREEVSPGVPWRIPWGWIVDETREPERVSSWENPQAFMNTVKHAYRRDFWALQPRRVEVWSEKGTVRGTVAPVLRDAGVTFRVMHGYASATAVNQVAEETQDCDRPLIALYCGDWDPSGLHMSERDLPRRLAEYGAQVDLRRLALTSADVAEPTLPSFDVNTKRGDTRWRWFHERYGTRCWELDAMNPVTLRERVASAISAEIDWPAWERCQRAEAAEQASLATVLDAWRGGISGQATK